MKCSIFYQYNFSLTSWFLLGKNENSSSVDRRLWLHLILVITLSFLFDVYSCVEKEHLILFFLLSFLLAAFLHISFFSNLFLRSYFLSFLAYTLHLRHFSIIVKLRLYRFLLFLPTFFHSNTCASLTLCCYPFSFFRSHQKTNFQPIFEIFQLVG
jgi:hypothetical protein